MTERFTAGMKGALKSDAGRLHGRTMQYQTDTGRLTGNCFTASLASILNVPIATLPTPEAMRTVEEDDADTSWYHLFNGWLQPQGVQLLSFPHVDGAWIPSGFSILLCRPNDIPHAVVAFDGEPIWNPMPGFGVKVGDLRPWTHWTVFQTLDPISGRVS
jgi:hypothetical protein